MATDFENTPMITIVKPKLDDGLELAVNEINTLLGQLSTDGEEMSEVEMMAFNVAVSRFNTLVTLMSGVYKNLCDGEKTIAQKM